MTPPPFALRAHVARAHAPARLHLDDPIAVQRARCAPPRGPLVIDCGQLQCQRLRGVAHVVSQLLLLRQAGATVWLRNVNAPLRACLRRLQLSPLFPLDEAG
ncbi:hypothetical protein GCM10028824_32990 [Hymenobacter segetis]|uniref:STAS domain-containing protein n=1 Tax=Hymenobacter segetis TaxID=2025509 RepID=A0ABU9LW90_9BACT